MAGICAVRATFKLHKEYQNFLQEGTIPVNLEPAAPQKKKAIPGQVAASLAPFAGMFLGLLMVWLSIFPFVLELFVGAAQSPETLLQGYRNWYIAILSAIALSVLLTVAGILISAKSGMRTLGSVRLMAVSLILPLLLGGALIMVEDLPGSISRANTDLEQMKSGRLQEVTVWLSPKVHASGLPGPYMEGQPEPVMDYGGIGDDTDGTWVHFYVPNCLNFSLDQTALYHEGESIQWNEAHARQYKIRYTANFHLVVSVEPVEYGSEAWSVPLAAVRMPTE